MGAAFLRRQATKRPCLGGGNGHSITTGAGERSPAQDKKTPGMREKPKGITKKLASHFHRPHLPSSLGRMLVANSGKGQNRGHSFKEYTA